MIGNAGSRWKAKYGPIGDPVNLSSRIEGATKHVGVPVLISEATRQAVRGGSRTRLCEARLAGMIEPVYLYELYIGEPDEEWDARRAGYEAALEFSRTGSWARAGQGIQHHLIQPTQGRVAPDMPTLAPLGACGLSQVTSGGRVFPVWEFGSK